MPICRNIIIMLVLACLASPLTVQGAPAKGVTKENSIKAAYLVNFIKVVKWPSSGLSSDANDWHIGILGDHEFGNRFERVGEQTIRGKNVRVHYIDSFRNDIEGDNSEAHLARTKRIQSCHLLFVCRSETPHLKEILSLTRYHPVLVVGEIKPFIEMGGMISFVTSGKKGGFEVNLTHSREVGLHISSKLLRLAERVVGKPK